MWENIDEVFRYDPATLESRQEALREALSFEKTLSDLRSESETMKKAIIKQTLQDAGGAVKTTAWIHIIRPTLRQQWGKKGCSGIYIYMGVQLFVPVYSGIIDKHVGNQKLILPTLRQQWGRK